jgi:hypothetical protein
MVDPNGMKDEEFSLSGYVVGKVQSALGVSSSRGGYVTVEQAMEEVNRTYEADVAAHEAQLNQEAIDQVRADLSRTPSGSGPPAQLLSKFDRWLLSWAPEDESLEVAQNIAVGGAILAGTIATGGLLLKGGLALGWSATTAGAIAGAGEGAVLVGGTALSEGRDPTTEEAAAGILGGAALGGGAGKLGELAGQLGRKPYVGSPEITTGRRTGPGSGLASQSREQLLGSKARYEKLIAEHRAKLEAYQANPLAHDNQGVLAAAPKERQAKIIAGRVEVLKGQIQKQEGELAKILARIRELE